MNLTDPTLALTSSLDGPVLAALARAGKPLTASEIARQSARGSEIGIRKVLARLVVQGSVMATEVGNARSYQLNRDHVAAPAILLLADLRAELWRRVARDVESWSVRPLYACVFGSAARQDGDDASDLDLLLVRPSTSEEVSKAGKSASLVATVGLVPDALTLRTFTDAQIEKWETKIDELRNKGRAWTGNQWQIVDLSSLEWARHRKEASAIYQAIRSDEVRLYDELSPVRFQYPKKQR